MRPPDALQYILLADNAYSVASSAHRRALTGARQAEAAGIGDEAHAVMRCHLNEAAVEILRSERDVEQLRAMGRTLGLLYTDDEPANADVATQHLRPVVERVLAAAGRILSAARAAEEVARADKVADSRDALVPLDLPAENQDPMNVPMDELGIERVVIQRLGGRGGVEVVVHGDGITPAVSLRAASIASAAQMAVRAWLHARRGTHGA